MVVPCSDIALVKSVKKISDGYSVNYYLHVILVILSIRELKVILKTATLKINKIPLDRRPPKFGLVNIQYKF